MRYVVAHMVLDWRGEHEMMECSSDIHQLIHCENIAEVCAAIRKVNDYHIESNWALFEWTMGQFERRSITFPMDPEKAEIS